MQRGRAAGLRHFLYDILHRLGGTWRTVYAQGFRANVTPSPDPGHASTDTVSLDRFQFFKGGLPTRRPISNWRLLAISFSTLLPGSSLRTRRLRPRSSVYQQIQSPTRLRSPLALQSPLISITCHLSYGFFDAQESFPANYAAIFVNNNGGVLTPVLVSTLSVNYVAGQNEIESDYGQPGDYFLSTSNFTHTDTSGTFFDTFTPRTAAGTVIPTSSLHSICPLA